MKRGISLLLMLLCVLCLNAQTEFTWTQNGKGKIIALPKRATFGLNMPKFDYGKFYTPSNRINIEEQLRKFKPDFRDHTDFRYSQDDRPMDMEVLSTAYKPFFNIYAPMIREISPMAFDFHEVSLVPVTPNLTFVTSGRQYTWPGLGGITRLNTELMWQSGKWTLTGGAFGGRFFTPFNPSPQFMGGFNAMAAYDISDWLTVKGWGQYAFYSKYEERNPHMLMNPFYNHTSVGGAFEIKVNDSGFKVGVGVNYEYNPIRGKMEPQFMLFPGGKIGRISIGN